MPRLSSPFRKVVSRAKARVLPADSLALHVNSLLLSTRITLSSFQSRYISIPRENSKAYDECII